MSNHAARPHAPAKPRAGKYALYIGLPMVIAFVVSIPLIHRWTVRPAAGWLSFPAQVLGTRIALIGSSERPYRGGEIDYRVEAHVRFRSSGIVRDLWLPASKVSDDKLFLEFWLAQHSKTSGVVWQNPHNPGDLLVTLD